MKKITLLAVVLIAASFASCKKTYTCDCTWTSDGTSAGSYTSGKIKKKDAKTWCEGNNSSTYVSCKLK